MIKTFIFLRKLFEFIDAGLIEVRNPYPTQKEFIHSLFAKYHDLPASFADICLLAMIDHERNDRVFTLDSNFLIYRNRKGRPLSLIAPFK